ncbi:MAG: hypothetical protein II557_04090 [Clostridia bacterium]|nr:hypothetical protein [Clostridia bacterium]
MKKTLSLLLALLMLLPVCAACGESKENTDASDSTPAGDASPSAAEETVPPEEAEETVLKDKVPELDFGGATVTMAGQGTGDAGNNNLDMTVEELTGDVVRDAIYQRTLVMEERFNVTVAEPLMADYTTISNAVKSMVKAGDSTYDFVVNQLAQTSADVVGGNSMNLNEIPYLDFNMRWYPANVMESASLNGKLFLIVSDMCLSYVGQTWSMCFNKDLTTDMGIDGLYDLAREGEWTVDKLHEITADIYRDVNGNGKRDEEDTYGFSMGSAGISGCLGAAMIYGAGQRYIDVNEDGTIVNLLESEHAQAVCEKFDTLNKQEGSTVYDTTGRRTITAMMERVAVFTPAQLGYYYVFARDFDGTFGVLPLPKFDAAQERYATLCDAGCNCISVPITCRDPELTGAMIEAMSAYSANYVNPVYVDIALQTKVARDEESAEMMEIVLDSRVMDFGYLYCGWNGWTWTLKDLFRDPGTYMSTLQKNLKVQNKTYEKIVKEFLD